MYIFYVKFIFLDVLHLLCKASIMKIELLEEKIVLKGKQVIEINYDEIDSVSLKVKRDNRRKYFLCFYLLMFFLIFSNVYISLFVMGIYFLVLCVLLFYKFEALKANAILFYHNKKLKLNLNDKNLESTIALIEILRLNYYKKTTTTTLD